MFKTLLKLDTLDNTLMFISLEQDGTNTHKNLRNAIIQSFLNNNFENINNIYIENERNSLFKISDLKDDILDIIENYKTNNHIKKIAIKNMIKYLGGI